MAVISFDFFSANVMKTVHTQVILPYGEADRNVDPPFKTLYFLPGFTDSAYDIVTVCGFRNYAKKHGIAIVILDGDNSFYVDQGPMVNYSKLVGEELVTVTRTVFNLSCKREDTYIGGMSMGGYGALYNGLRYADLFGKIALLCPGFDCYDAKAAGTDVSAFPSEFLDRIFGSRENYYATDLDYRVAFDRLEKRGSELPEIFHACGDSDLLVGEINKKFKAYWEEKGLPIKYCEKPGGHDEIFMYNILPHFFNFLGGKDEE